MRKRRGTFARYTVDESLQLVDIISCAGGPTLTGSDKLLQRIRGLTDFCVDAVHFANCVKALHPFREKYAKALREAFPDIEVVIGTHEEHMSYKEFGVEVKKLFCQPKKTMLDAISGND